MKKVQFKFDQIVLFNRNRIKNNSFLFKSNSSPLPFRSSSFQYSPIQYDSIYELQICKNLTSYRNQQITFNLQCLSHSA